MLASQIGTYTKSSEASDKREDVKMISYIFQGGKTPLNILIPDGSSNFAGIPKKIWKACIFTIGNNDMMHSERILIQKEERK